MTTTKAGFCLSCGRNAIVCRVPVMGGRQWRWRCKPCIDKRAGRNKELQSAEGSMKNG